MKKHYIDIIFALKAQPASPVILQMYEKSIPTFFSTGKVFLQKKNMFLQPCLSAVKYQRTKSAPLADECASTKAEAQKKHSKVQLLILPLISKPNRNRFKGMACK